MLQRDPLVEYKLEGYNLFLEMMAQVGGRIGGGSGVVRVLSVGGQEEDWVHQPRTHFRFIRECWRSLWPQCAVHQMLPTLQS